MQTEGDALQSYFKDVMAATTADTSKVQKRYTELEQSPEDADLLATVFRGFHTIKGGAGFLEATHLVELCHKTENLFDLLRSKKLVLDAEMMDSIMAAVLPG